MELQSLVLKHYRVEKQGKELIITEDEQGNYKAPSKDSLHGALTYWRVILPTDNLFMRMNPQGKWYPMTRKRTSKP